jgi:hypothetical protein
MIDLAVYGLVDVFAKVLQDGGNGLHESLNV